jgi:hypothetical protein
MVSGADGVCTPQCKSNYKLQPVNNRTDYTLTCTNGVLTPATYTCVPDPCDAPVAIQNANWPSCKEGETVHGDSGTCTPNCLEGYHAADATEGLTCLAGKLVAPAFTCTEKPCPAPRVQYAYTPSCEQGPSIDGTNGTCTMRCMEPNYIPVTANLTCSLGEFDALPQCIPKPCDAPAVGNASAFSSCQEGLSIRGNGSTCTPNCATGWYPTELSLTCTEGVLTPNWFGCSDVNWCGNCLVAYGWQTNIQCEDPQRSYKDRRASIINLLVKQGKVDAQTPPMTDRELLEKCETAGTPAQMGHGHLDWCKICLIHKSYRTQTSCADMNEAERRMTTIEELVEAGIAQPHDQLESMTFQQAAAFCAQPHVVSEINNWLIQKGDNPWLCQKKDDCMTSPEGNNCLPNIAMPTLSNGTVLHTCQVIKFEELTTWTKAMIKQIR